MWFEIDNANQLNTPCLAVYPSRIRRNLKAMKSIVGDAKRLCPHVKTHKSSAVVDLFIEAQINQFKCANLAELAMVAQSQARFALHAMQCVGPQVEGFVGLASKNPHCRFGTLVDNPVSLRELANQVSQHGIHVDVLIDLNNGMDRTGIRPDTEEAFQLYQQIAEYERSGLRLGGFHVYDGHIHDRDPDERASKVEHAMSAVLALRERLLSAGLAVPRLLTGGTPSFPIHAKHEDRICCPGTPSLWDAGYADMYPDLDFLPSAVLVSRVISCLENDRYCLNLGYKSIAAEMRPPRAKFLNVPVAEEISHSEEHLVVRLEGASSLAVGDTVFALPWHICPTVARHHELLVIEDRQVVDRWPVDARDRRLPC